MDSLSIDIETFSSVDLKKCGVYKYAESPDFEILLFGYSVDGNSVKVVDLACGETIPKTVLDALSDNSVTKWAFNAQFERVCLSKYLGVKLDAASWKCSMIWAATLGLPLSLEGAGAVLGLEKQKLTEGKELIRYFCTPARLKDGTAARHLPSDNPERWKAFKKYNRCDVEVEMGIKEKLAKFPVSESEWVNYRLDQKINDRGIMLDMPFVRSAIKCDDGIKSENIDEVRRLTGVNNPNSVTQMKEWLSSQGLEVDSLSKAAVTALMETASDDVERVLMLRRQLSKSSVKKYTAMENAVCCDSRARGLIQFYGANRTGRYSGRLIQVQNLPKNNIPDIAEARELVKSENYEACEMLYDCIPLVLSELIRTAFIPKKGCRFYVADFSAIEARVIAWLAGEEWRIETFKEGKDIYCASASQMFGVPVEKHGVNGHLRQKGKIAELALGYGGSVGALTAMGALDMGLSEEELKPLVNVWRQSNPKIVKLWYDIDKAVIKTVEERSKAETHGIFFYYQSGFLFIRLPSGRRLAYVKPRIGENRFGGKSVTYEGISGVKKWERLESYGAKFVENIVQAISRDILAEAMLRLDAAGFDIVMHVHDEAVIEAPKDTSLENICAIMGQTPSWAKGLLLRADGYECDFYRKD